MNFRRFLIPSTLAFSSFTFAASAEQIPVQTVIAPFCFFENSSIQFKELAKYNDFVLVQAKMSDLELLKDQIGNKPCRFFKNVSTDWNEFKNTVQNKNSSQKINSVANRFLSQEIVSSKHNELSVALNAQNFEIKYQNEVNEILKSFNKDRLWAALQTLTSFENRYPNSDSGVKVADWFKKQAEDLAQATNRTDITVQMIKTGNVYKQPSVLVKVPGTDPNLDPVLLGAHMDTLNGVRPGADDDGSGSVTALEAMRTILHSGVKFKRTMYFVWYSAEEQGLVGSQFVVKYFKDNKIPLVGALQLDMTGYQAKPENKIWMIEDYVDPSLSKFVADLAVNYAKVEVGHTQCGYACSDHASWSAKGYRSATPFETKFGEDSPYIHTINDTISTISLDHMSRFTVVGVSFMGELAEPVK